MKSRTRKLGRQAGIGLAEVVISATILLVLTASMIEAISQIGSLGRTGGVEARLQQATRDSIARITRDLESAGFAAANGKTYPYLFVDGDATGAFAAHAHAPAAEHAAADDADFGPNREIVFVQPAFAEVAQDADGNNHELFDADGLPIALDGVDVVKRYAFPAIGADGSAAFDASEIAYVLVTAADGVNELQRRRDGASPTVVARGVERLVFDTSDTDPVGVPVGAVRVRLWARIADERGTVHRRSVETVVRLQNGS